MHPQVSSLLRANINGKQKTTTNIINNTPYQTDGRLKNQKTPDGIKNSNIPQNRKTKGLAD